MGLYLVEHQILTQQITQGFMDVGLGIVLMTVGMFTQMDI